MTAAQSVDAVSEEFLALQARANDDGTITTDIESISVYPYESEWVIRYSLGNPLPSYFARERVQVEDRFDGVRKLATHYTGEQNTLEQIDTIDITLDPSDTTGVSTNTPEEATADTCIRINGRIATMSELHTANEYFANKEDINTIQTEIAHDIQLYYGLHNSTPKECQISSVETPSERTLRLSLDGFDSGETFSVEISLPPLSEIAESPITEFINRLGCGQISELGHERVYVLQQDDSTIGCDTRFKKYGVCARPPSAEQNNKSLFSRVLDSLIGVFILL